MKPRLPKIRNDRKLSNRFVALIALCFLAVLHGYSQPTISSFSPTSGPAGTSVTITGTNFGSNIADNVVYFGVAKATVTAASATALTVTAPSGANYQPIAITVNTLTAWSNAPFILTQGSGCVITSSFLSPKTDFATSTSPYGVAIGDLDGDGKPDVAVAANGGKTISIYRNTSTSGAITFAARADISLGTDDPNNVIIGDLDGDGKPDLATGNLLSSNVSILRNTSTVGSISFDTHVDFSTGFKTRWVTMGDVDGDGKPDLFVVSNGGVLSLLRNTTTSGAAFSTSSFSAAVNFATDGNPQMAAFGDLDGDGKPDIAVTSYNSSTVSLFRNTSTKGVAFSSSTLAAKVDLAATNNATGVAIGDLDGDGKPDIVACNRTSSTVSLFRNVITSSGAFSTSSFDPKVDLSTGSTTWRIAIADLDMDGKPDIAVVNSGAATASVLKNTTTTGAAFSTSSFNTQVTYATGTTPQDIAVADLDGDNWPDILAGNWSSNSISTLLNTAGSGGCTLPLHLISLTGHSSAGQQIQLNWQTVNEVNTASFEIEHAPDGAHFTGLGAVTAADNNSGESDYSYTDTHSRIGENYYRLRMVDIDGRYTYSPIVEVTLTGRQSGLSPYPNPASGSVYVQVPSSRVP
ncbi:MAG TPA: FG-GAP-like repeat-containing protein, partial [Puia sp.]|nr:FG-GAP-like repeat-containing protein [Puia sp.]